MTETQEQVADGFQAASDQVDAGFTETQEKMDASFEGAETRLGNQIGAVHEAMEDNFEVTNERTATEITDLRDELTQVLDRRFNQVDQTFASLRADFEVLKALQMELVKERVGRPELVRQQS